MAIKRLNENPNITDQIIIDLMCPDADGCFTANPYKVENVTIYYVQRSYAGGNFSHYDRKLYDESLKQQLDDATKEACNDPSEENLAEVERLRTLFNASVKIDAFYYNDARPVLVLGDADNPAWLESDTGNATIVNIQEDENGDTVFGRFELNWQPKGLREGDYFICWNWNPLPAGDTLSNHMYFALEGNTSITTCIPTHFTNPEKYSTLLDRYLPEMYKMALGDGDLSPEVFHEFNNALAKNFTFIEDMANQMVDLIDANAVPESLLSLLNNLFHQKLRSDDPTLWRRQIKEAIPLFKKKGTYNSLVEALAQADIRLKRYAQLWQIISQYTYQEHFLVTDTDEFVLSKMALLPVDLDNFELYYRPATEDDWQLLSADYVSLSNSATITNMSWVGDQLSYLPIELVPGDSLRVIYQIAEVPDVDAQQLESYIRTLPLADQRDERDQDYPLKNWNVRVIEQDDVLFDLIVSTRHPFYDPLNFGKIRTEFPYSENIYNMDEYNGSRRDSQDPCDIDKDFIDPCSMCISSQFNVDLEIGNLNSDRIAEAREIIRDFVPFHAILHSMNIIGSIDELILPPVEQIQALVNFSGNEFTISGNAQMIFNRTMTELSQFKRDELSNVTLITSNTGTGFNENIVLFTPNQYLDQISLDADPDYTYLEVLSPSANAGTYTVSGASKNYANVDGVTEPLDQSAFTFRLSNERGSKATADIAQDDIFKFTDANVDFGEYAIRTQWDVINSAYDGGAWKVYISAYASEFEIKNVSPDGELILDDPSQALPVSTTTGISYILRNDEGENIETSSTGKLTVTRRGRVDLGTTFTYRGSTVTLTNVRELMDSYHDNGVNHYVLYSGIQYRFAGFVDGSTSEFYISDYTSGDVVGANIKIYQRLLNNHKGYFHYRGLKLTAATNLEVGLGIRNGENADTLYSTIDAHGDTYTLQLENDTFKENFLILIDTSYYAIAEIDGNEIWLSGPLKEWELTGTSVSYAVYKYEKLGGNIPERNYPYTPGHDFDLLDRRGNEVIDSETANLPVEALALAFNLVDQGDQILDTVTQTEGISFSIQTRDGSLVEGEI